MSCNIAVVVIVRISGNISKPQVELQSIRLVAFSMAQAKSVEELFGDMKNETAKPETHNKRQQNDSNPVLNRALSSCNLEESLSAMMPEPECASVQQAVPAEGPAGVPAELPVGAGGPAQPVQQLAMARAPELARAQ